MEYWGNQEILSAQKTAFLCSRKCPSEVVLKTLDWARALVTLNAQTLDRRVLDNTLSVLLKHETDMARARQAFDLGGGNGSNYGSPHRYN